MIETMFPERNVRGHAGCSLPRDFPDLLDSSAKSGDVFAQDVLSGCVSTLHVGRFHFRLSQIHVAC